MGFAAGGATAGLGGVLRLGAWTPLRVELENPTARDVSLTVSWWLADAVGDRVEMRREVAVPAGRTTASWLYGVPGGPPPGGAGGGWPVVATDAEGTVVASSIARFDTPRRLAPGEEFILRLSSADLGLDDYARHAASHAQRRLVGGLGLADLPDRVQGLLGVSAIVWAPDSGGNPAAADVPAAALSQWVQRGGHLVIVLPAIGEQWTQSPLAPLLPLAEGAMPRRQAVRLPALGVTRPAFAEAAEALVFPEAGGAVLLRSLDGEPLVITARRGFGAVTLVGLDLSSAAYRETPLPSGTRRLWNDVFGWSDPAISPRREATLRGETTGKPPEIKPARELPPVEAGAFAVRSLGLAGSVALTLTILLFLLVLLPVLLGAAWAWARARKAEPDAAAASASGAEPGGRILDHPLRFAWPLFAAGCVVAAAGCATIALLGRPEGPSVRHQSVIDVDVLGGLQRVHSRVSLFVPGFGRAAVEVQDADPGSTLLSSETPAEGAAGPGFLDPQAYSMEAADPQAADLPLRSTTRPLRLDALRTQAPEARKVRALGQPSHRAGTGRLQVRLESSLPVDLRDVLVVYCPGEAFGSSGREPLPPLAWRFPGVAGGAAGVWPAGATLEIDRVPGSAVRLTAVAPLGAEGKGFRGAGWLNVVLDQSGVGAAASPGPGAALVDPVRAWEALSFFGRLPMPDISTVAPPNGGRLVRTLPELLQLDLSSLTNGPRLFVLGHAQEDALPLPLSVDGAEPPSSGRTLYRLLVDLADAS